MKKRIVVSLHCLGIAGLVFAFGDLLIDQENVIFKARQEPVGFAKLTASTAYLWWAGRGFLGVFLEMVGTVGLYLYLQKTKAERWAFVGLLLTLAHQMFGIGVFAIAYFLFPAAGHLFQAGVSDAISYVTMERALAVFFGISLITTLTGLFCMAVAVQKSGKLPRFTGWMAFIGFALIPVPGVVIQFLANLIWGAAYFRMAWHIDKTMVEPNEPAFQEQAVL